MKIQWNKVTWYSKVAAVVLGLAIFALGIYIGIIYQRGMDALEWAEQLRIDRPIPLLEERTVLQTEKRYEYAQEGNIKNDTAGGDGWMLIYEKPGAPALTAKLVFTTDSRCVADERVGLCDMGKFDQGRRVRVLGHKNDNGEVVVERLEML